MAQKKSLEAQLFRSIDLKNERNCLKLLEKGANVNALDDNGYPPLYWACFQGLESVALKLLEKGASITYKDGGVPPLHVACAQRLERLALKLIEKGAPLNTPDILGNTPLYYACGAGSESVALKIIEKNGKIDSSDNSDNPQKDSFERMKVNSSIRDVNAAMLRHVVLPQLFAGATKQSPLMMANERTELIFGHLISELNSELLPDVFDVLYPKPAHIPNSPPSEKQLSEFLRPMRLSRTWHHAGVHFPPRLTPILQGREWHSILPKPIALTDGLTLHCLTNSDMLKEEGKRLNHCVGISDYDQQCCLLDPDQRSHILSIRNAEGEPLSTLQVRVTQHKQSGGSIVSSIKVVQHHGRNDKAPPKEAKAAWDNFIKRLEAPNSTIQLIHEPLGETPASIQNMEKYSLLERNCGFTPTQEAVNACFDEYRMPYRRASVVTQGRGLKYDEPTKPLTEDGYPYPDPTHFIAGFVVVNEKGDPCSKVRLHRNELTPKSGEHIVDLRTLDALSWCRATGLLERGREIIRQKRPELAEELKSVWEEQDKQPLRKRDIPKPRYQIDAETAAANRALDERYRAYDEQDRRERNPYFS